MAIKFLRPFLMDNWLRIREALLNGTYQPLSVRRVEIPKPDGGIRLLGIPTVVDRLIQQELLQVLTPIFDSKFSPLSYGFRRGYSAHQAGIMVNGICVASEEGTPQGGPLSPLLANRISCLMT